MTEKCLNKRNHPLFPSNPSLKTKILSSPPSLFVKRLNPPSPLPLLKGGDAHYESTSGHVIIPESKLLCTLFCTLSSPFLKRRRKTLVKPKHKHGFNGDWDRSALKRKLCCVSVDYTRTMTQCISPACPWHV